MSRYFINFLWHFKITPPYTHTTHTHTHTTLLWLGFWSIIRRLGRGRCFRTQTRSHTSNPGGIFHLKASWEPQELSSTPPTKKCPLPLGNWRELEKEIERGKGGAAATTPRCHDPPVPARSPTPLPGGRRAASESCESCASPSPGVQSAGTPAPPQAGGPEPSLAPLPPSPPSRPYTMSGIRADTELGADITPSPRYLPSLAPSPRLPAGMSQRERAGGASARRASRWLGPRAVTQRRPLILHIPLWARRWAGSGCWWRKMLPFLLSVREGESWYEEDTCGWCFKLFLAHFPIPQVRNETNLSKPSFEGKTVAYVSRASPSPAARAAENG